MLQKISHIKNIGRFYDVTIKGTADSNPSLKKFNLIYADNGTGKSTIATILKSLCENDPDRLIEKKTIGSADESNIELSISSKTYTFQNKKWNKTPDATIEIFDEEFVAKNVFSSNGIETENRRELFNYVILGKESVSNVEKIKQLDETTKHLSNKISNAEKALLCETGIKDISVLDKSVELESNELEILENSIKNNDNIIKNTEHITNGKKLGKLPDFEVIPYKETVAIDLKKLSLTTEYKTHVEIHNEWIKDGMEIMKNKNDESSCPFCFQNIEGNKAVATYIAFFSEEYDSLRKKVIEQIASTERIYNDAAIQNINSLIKYNNERCIFWSELHKEIPKSIHPDISIDKVINAVKTSLKGLLERKKENLLEKIDQNENESEGLDKETEFRNAIFNYNLSVAKINSKIQAIQDTSQNIEELKRKNEADRVTLTCNKIRYRNEKTAEIYKELTQYREQKKHTESKIKMLQNDIDNESKRILEKYKKNINRELERFGVEFSIEEVKRKSDSTRMESIHFSIKLKNAVFSPSGSDDSLYKLSNTLSSGDKSTLAFAFFIAKYREENISNQILVFDDPITSLDFFRKNQTANTIRRFAQGAAQVIVLTHCIRFAELISKINPKDSCFIHIQKNDLPSGLQFTFYNKFSDMPIKKHHRDHNLITNYIKDPTSVNRLEVMRSIRPYLETTISKYRPGLNSLSLGQIIRELKNKGNICPHYIEDLEDINKTIVPESSHGGRIDDDDYQKIEDNELMTICEKAVKISGRSSEVLDQLPCEFALDQVEVTT